MKIGQHVQAPFCQHATGTNGVIPGEGCHGKLVMSCTPRLGVHDRPHASPPSAPAVMMDILERACVHVIAKSDDIPEGTEELELLLLTDAELSSIFYAEVE